MNGDRITPCEDPRGASRYEVSADRRSITFFPCGITSWHPEDVARRWCNLCGYEIPSGQVLPEARA